MEITKNQLSTWYKEMTNKQLCEKLDISEPTLIKLLDDNNIPKKGKGNKKVRVI